MNNEIKEENNVVEQKIDSNSKMTEKNNGGSNKAGLIIALVILLLSAVGFVCYDNFIKKEKTPASDSSATDISNNGLIENNILVSTIEEKTAPADGENGEITLSNGKTLRFVYSEIDDCKMYVGDKLVEHKYESEIWYFVTDKYIVFLEGLICDEKPSFAIDLDGNMIPLEMKDLDYYYDDYTCPKSGMKLETFTIEDGRVVVESHDSGKIEFLYNGKNIIVQVVK